MWCVLTAATLLTACTATHDAVAVSTGPSSAATSAPSSVVTDAPAARTKNWFDLDVGDCVAEIPAVEVGEVSATVVDCTTPHLAEVYLREPTAVDTAIADVANRVCGSALADYPAGEYVPAYLIDSNQDRTSDNPLPSTIICLLQASGGGQLDAPARR
ncbi:hypothetical protein JDV09_05440 [Mycobacterium sp. Y57]|nr:hypothetical protein [Mycolicibacterium xanthum]